jgi:hypothetical protein
VAYEFHHIQSLFGVRGISTNQLVPISARTSILSFYTHDVEHDGWNVHYNDLSIDADFDKPKRQSLGR